MTPDSECEFEALEDEVERLASGPRSQAGPSIIASGETSGFEQLVRSALDELPSDVLDDLKNVAIVISDRGAEHRAYGLYSGTTVKAQNIAANQWLGTDQIFIFRDTLVRDFGRDPGRLTAEVRRVVRHEVAHHLGFDEAGVRRLGL